ncbi:MAG: exodeoxyribonuclease V subunit gamma [Fibromonadaceae bacterium]|jgi:exodeoxyribonuclease V gamma subunit|nr:exodeoxyribonuclease V subunit gamma [Fibromonadaceae bacterium]
MHIFPHINIGTLASKLLEDILSKSNFEANSTKGGFLTGGSVIVCESKGLQEYLQKECADKYGIWTALPFKPLAGLLMQCAYNLSPKNQKKDEQENVFNANNLVWAIYRFLKGSEKTFSFASEIATLFAAYQIYRPELIEIWNKGEIYEIKGADSNFKNNEKWQRELWLKLKKEYNEPDISELYKLIEHELSGKNFLPKQIFVFAPLSIAPIHLKTLSLLSQVCKINLYLLQISTEYIGTHLSDKKIANLRKESWQKNKILNENELYWDLGNRLIANLGRNAQVLYEQILEIGIGDWGLGIGENDLQIQTLLQIIQNNIINDSSQLKILNSQFSILNSLTFNNCFSPLRETEVLCDYILDLFVNNKELTPADIAVVSPNIENYASAIESVFERNKIPYKIADRDVKKSSKTAQLLNLLFAQIGSRHEAPDIVALFEYSMYVQSKELEASDRELLEKWVRENAIRHGLKSDRPLPNYSFESGFEQLAAGFFMVSENEFSEKGDYCYPDIEGNPAKILGDFIFFVNALREFEEASKKEKSIEDWDYFFKEKFQIFFGTDEVNFHEDKDNPYQKIINVWDSLKKEMLIGFGGNSNTLINFSLLKSALPRKLESNAKSSYSLSGMLSFSNLETTRALPHKVICCIGMNSKEFPRQNKNKEISIIDAKYEQGDKDTANEDRHIFLETILSAKEALYISWVGQDEKNAEELEPSSVVTMLLKNLKEQYGIDTKSLVTKHPLQPFSKKYYNGTLSTYDNRWIANKESCKSFNQVNQGSDNIWQWEVSVEIEEKKDIDSLYRILSDAPKYFLRTVCNIELPEDASLLEDTEPFIVERGLGEWELADLILKNRNIEIAKLRGELPSGKFADKIIEKKIEEVYEMKKMEDENVKTFIRPSNDKGKHRLWHWLKHLELNLEEAMDSDIILKTGKIRLPKLSKEKTQKEIEKLWKLADALKTKMLPIFPDAAWAFLKSEENENKKIRIAEKSIFENEYNSQYTKMLLGSAKSFKDLGVEKEFVECSEKLFENYNGVEVNFHRIK